MSENIEKLSDGFHNVILSRRSIRRFKQKAIDKKTLKKLVNAGRLAPSAANLQPLEYFIINDEKLCSDIFETIKWAAYIKPEWKPIKKERPTAYILMLVTDTKNKYYLRDVSLATENIVLAAEAEKIGSCILCNIDREKIRSILKIPLSLNIDSLIALGYKAEYPVIEDLKDSVKYWRDEEMVLHVPKRKLENIIHINKF